LSFVAKIQHEFLQRVKLLATVVIMAFVLWALFWRWSLFASTAPSEVILKIGPITVDKLGLVYGFAMPFRVLVMIGTPMLFFMTTRLSEFVLCLVKLKLPYKWAFAFGLSAKLVSLLGDEFETIKHAQTARGLELEKGNLIRRIKAYVPILIPLTLRGLELSDQISIAMDTKAFGVEEKRTFYRDLKMKRIDYLIVIFSFIALVIGIILRLFGIGVIV
jgi:energy-coupling factor transport system permease protein